MTRTGTKTPLTILVLPPVTRWKAELEELETAGHTLWRGWDDVPYDRHAAADLIIGRAAWHMDNTHRPYLAKAVAAAQARVKAAKKAAEGDDAT